jgi:hypothetical protein
MSRARLFRTTSATAATVARWATLGKKRLRAKYRGATVTACRILNRRELPLVGEFKGAFGLLVSIKMSWGVGYVRARGAESTIGWYGEWHCQHGGLDRPLHCLADLRRWARDQPRGQVGLEHHGRIRLGDGRPWDCDGNTESLRALRGKGRR